MLIVETVIDANHKIVGKALSRRDLGSTSNVGFSQMHIFPDCVFVVGRPTELNTKHRVP